VAGATRAVNFSGSPSTEHCGGADTRNDRARSRSMAMPLAATLDFSAAASGFHFVLHAVLLAALYVHIYPGRFELALPSPNAQPLTLRVEVPAA